MFTRCIFCNGDLGANEALEHFPVGKRLVYVPLAGAVSQLFFWGIMSHQRLALATIISNGSETLLPLARQDILSARFGIDEATEVPHIELLPPARGCRRTRR